MLPPMVGTSSNTRHQQAPTSCSFEEPDFEDRIVSLSQPNSHHHIQEDLKGFIQM